MRISKRHLLKTISWRCLGTLDTLILSWLISGDIFVGVKISSVEILTKMILYYIHERLWFKSSVLNSKKRHLYKTFSWRFLGTADTVLIGWLISGDPLIGLQIGFAEVISKMILYYFHERIWFISNYGVIKN